MKYLPRAVASTATVALCATLASAATTAVPTRNLLTTEYHNNVPTIVLRGSQLSAVVTSMLPLESIAYYQAAAGFFIVSVSPVVGSTFDSASCGAVTFDHAVCTDTAPGSNAAIDILGDPRSEYVGNYRTFKITYRARDPRANGYIYSPVRDLALSVVLSDNDTPRNLVREYVGWAPQP